VKKVEHLSLPDEFIPIIIISSKSKVPMICESSLSIEEGDKIIIIDLSKGAISLDKAFLKDCSQLKV
jgi:hypothetical protein